MSAPRKWCLRVWGAVGNRAGHVTEEVDILCFNSRSSAERMLRKIEKNPRGFEVARENYGKKRRGLFGGKR